MKETLHRRGFLWLIAGPALANAGVFYRPKPQSITASAAAESMLKLLHDGDLDAILSELPENAVREAVHNLRFVLAKVSEQSANINCRELLALTDAALVREVMSRVRYEIPEVFNVSLGKTFQVLGEIPASADRIIVAYRAIDEDEEAFLGQPRVMLLRDDAAGFSLLPNPQIQTRSSPDAIPGFDSIEVELSSLSVQVTEVAGAIRVAGRSYCCVFTRSESSAFDCEKASLVEVAAHSDEELLLANQDWGSLKRHYAALWRISVGPTQTSN